MSADKDEMDDMADLRFEFEAMRERAEKAEAQLASITGVTRLELVAAERAKRDGLLAALEMVRDADEDCKRDGLPRWCTDIARRRIDDAIAAAEAAP